MRIRRVLNFGGACMDMIPCEVDLIEYRLRLFADGDEGEGGSGGEGDAGGGSDAGEGAGSNGNDSDAAGGTGGVDGAKPGEAGAADDGGDGAGQTVLFTDALTSDATRKFADGSPDLEHLVGRAVTLREQLSKAIIPPGKDATDTEVAAYRKQIGVPKDADGYKISMPEGQEETEVDKAFHATLATAFHDLNVPTATAEALNALVNDHTLALTQMLIDQDAKYAEESEAELRRQWPADSYDANLEISNRAMQRVFPGDSFDEFRMLETKAGTLVADMPLFHRAFAILGKEMEAGGLAPALSEGEQIAARDQLTEIRAKISDAQGRGDTKEANRLYTQEQALISKTQGNSGIVGSQGRAA